MEEARTDHGQLDVETLDSQGVPDESTGTVTDDTTGDGSPESEAQTELEALRQKAFHGDRKITELGQANSDFRAELSARDQQIAALQAQVSALHQQRQPHTQQQNYDYDYGDHGEGQPGVTADVLQRLSDYETAVQAMVPAITSVQNDLNELKGTRTRETRQQQYMREFGLNEENAQLALHYEDAGDMASAHKVITLASAPAQARNAAKADQRRQRDVAAEIPRGGAPAASAGSDDTSAPPTTPIAELNDSDDWQTRAQAISDALSTDTNLFDKLAKQFVNKR